MSIFKANKKYLSLAQMYMEQAKGIQEQQQDIDFGRQLLSNIRQYRIQQAALDIQDLGREGISVSGFQSARQGLQTQLTQPYQYAVDDAERQEEIAELQTKANQALKKYKKQAKTARTTGFITAAALGVAGGFIGGAVAAGAAGATTASIAGGAAIGGAVGTAVGGGIGAASGADRHYYGGVVQGGIAGTSIAVAGSAAFMGPAAAAGGASSGTVSYTLADGGATMTAAAAPSTSWTASQWLAAGSIVSTIGGAVKDINNYEVKLPVSQAYTGQNYSQYVQSFRGFA